MDFFKSITQKEQQLINDVHLFIEQANRVIASEEPSSRLGLVVEYDNKTVRVVRKGDVILDVGNKSVALATGEKTINGKYVVKYATGLRTVEPEFIHLGALSQNPVIKRVVGRLQTKYPDRRVLVYGDTSLAEGTTSPEVVEEDKKLPNIFDNFGKRWKNERVKTKSSVNVDSNPYSTFLSAGGVNKIEEPGDCNPGNVNKKANKK